MAVTDQFNTDGDGACASVMDVGREFHIAHVWCDFEVESEEGQGQANARLIAAAPELLEALSATMTALRHCRDSAPAEWDALSRMAAFAELMRAWDANKTAIAKAEGGQS